LPSLSQIGSHTPFHRRHEFSPLWLCPHPPTVTASTTNASSLQEEKILLDEWEPEPLVKPATREEVFPVVTEGVVGTKVKINGALKLNLGRC
jgi:hypothetical protein